MKRYPEISKCIREREEHSRSVLRKAIRESVREAKSLAWEDKRAYGSHTRHILLTYALLRGIPRSAVERVWRTGASRYQIQTIAKSFGVELTPEQVCDWLDGVDPEAPTPGLWTAVKSLFRKILISPSV